MPADLNLTNHFLLAMPSLMDPNFRGTLTYICEHNEQGAMGIVVNRPLELRLMEILNQMEIDTDIAEIGETPIYYGGPVDNGRGFVLHSLETRWEATMPIGKAIGVTSSRDILIAMARGTGPKKALIALGYSGWAAGQLERELSENAWLTCPACADILFDLQCDEKLSAAAAQLGVDLAFLTSDVGHA